MPQILARELLRFRPTPLREPDEDDDVLAAIDAWRSASATLEAAQRSGDPLRPDAVFPAYARALKAMSRMRPATSRGLVALANALVEDMRNCADGTIVFEEVDSRGYHAMLLGILEIVAGQADIDVGPSLDALLAAELD